LGGLIPGPFLSGNPAPALLVALPTHP
jgi:hypothetical protein